MSTNWIEVTMFERGNFRRELTKAGIEFTETRSLTASVFVIPDTEDYLRIYRSLKAQGLL